MGGASVDSRGIAVSHSLFFFFFSRLFLRITWPQFSRRLGDLTPCVWLGGGGLKEVRGAEKQTHGHVFAAPGVVCSMNLKPDE